jgi:hypothetical protein
MYGRFPRYLTVANKSNAHRQQADRKTARRRCGLDVKVGGNEVCLASRAIGDEPSGKLTPA